MKIRFLLLGTSLSFIPSLTFAQCVATQDCATLGYTETSCSGGSGVKCPFGNKWACFKSESEYEQEFCTKYGFTNACSGTNQTGVGKACNGKYYECTCTSGYIWNDSSQKCEYDYKTNCVIGALYYSDGTCSDKLESSKTLLGIVIYEKSASQNGWVMTHKRVKSYIRWSTESVNVPGITSTTNWHAAAKDFDSCGNTDKIRAQGNSSKYPAAWAAYNYQPSGTPTGKRWCLPAAGLINSLYNNLSTINTAIGKAGGTKLDNEHILSSSEYNSDYVWVFCTEHGAGSGGLFGNGKGIHGTSGDIVRAVLAF